MVPRTPTTNPGSLAPMPEMFATTPSATQNTTGLATVGSRTCFTMNRQLIPSTVCPGLAAAVRRRRDTTAASSSTEKQIGLITSSVIGAMRNRYAKPSTAPFSPVNRACTIGKPSAKSFDDVAHIANREPSDQLRVSTGEVSGVR